MTFSIRAFVLIVLLNALAACPDAKPWTCLRIPVADGCSCAASFDDPQLAELQVAECSVASEGAGSFCCKGAVSCDCMLKSACYVGAGGACYCGSYALNMGDRPVDSCHAEDFGSSGSCCMTGGSGPLGHMCTCDATTCAGREDLTPVPSCEPSETATCHDNEITVATCS